MPSVSIFGGAPRTVYIILRQTFTGDGSDKTFQLTSSVGNCTFDKGSWSVDNIETAYPAHVTGTDKEPTYDSTNLITRNRIGVSSIDSSGLVTLDYAPRDGVSFYVWYWYALTANDEVTYYREDFVASMEEQGAAIAGSIAVDVTNFNGILSSADTTVQAALDTIDDISLAASGISADTTNFDAILSASEDTVQKALDILDDHLHDGQTLQIDGISSDGGAFSFTTSGAVTFNQNVNTQALDVTGNVTVSGTVDGIDVAALSAAYNAHLHNAQTLENDGITPASGTLTVTGVLNLATLGTHELQIGGNRAIAMPVDNTNIAIGYQAGNGLSTGQYNTMIGYQAGLSMTTNDEALFIGYQAGLYLDASNGIAIGYQAGLGVAGSSTGINNVFIGHHAGKAITTGAGNFCLGTNSGDSITTGDNNIAIGIQALQTVSTTDENVAVGWQAAYLGSPSRCVYIGPQSGYGAGTNAASHNIGVGYRTLYAITTGLYNVGICGNANLSITTGDDNIGIGLYAIRCNATGDHNIGIGQEALEGVTSNNFSNNIGIGYQAGTALTTGGNNILIGYQAGDVLTTGTGNIIIGYDIDPSAAGATNEINIGGVYKGDTSAVTANIAGTLTITGNLVIADAGYIGSVSDTDAIQIEADGDVIFSQCIGVSDTVIVGATTPTTIARLEVEDGGTAHSVLLKITQDDANTFGLVIGNDTYSTNDQVGLRFCVGNTGGSFIQSNCANDLYIDSIGAANISDIYLRAEDNITFQDYNGGTPVTRITFDMPTGAATFTGNIHATGLKSGADQAAAGAAAGELWHDTDDNTIKMGV